jgi:hypothetical protein
MQGFCHFNQHGWFRTIATQASAERVPRDVGSFAMPQPNNIDQRALGRVQANSITLLDFELLTCRTF